MPSAAVCHAHIHILKCCVLTLHCILGNAIRVKCTWDTCRYECSNRTLALETFISHKGRNYRKTVCVLWLTNTERLSQTLLCHISHCSVLSNGATMADKMVQSFDERGTLKRLNMDQNQHISGPLLSSIGAAGWFSKAKSCQWLPLISNQVWYEPRRCRDKPWECADCLCCQRRILSRRTVGSRWPVPSERWAWESPSPWPWTMHFHLRMTDEVNACYLL